MKNVLFAIALTATVSPAALANPSAKAAPKAEVASKDIVDTALADPRFSTLVEAVKAAGLVDTLKGKGPFTVFAPTNDAFAKIPQDQLKALIADKKKLTAVLTYHVVPGALAAADVAKLKSVKTAEGRSAKIEASKNGVKIGAAKVIVTDVKASNGVIHAIDTVLLP
ncbi:MAG: fasciclin domain-containing protein [Kofleriaceae bacterium]|nr:fasciclin domain-containing protein [Kofleriaceae bacterium]